MRWNNHVLGGMLSDIIITGGTGAVFANTLTAGISALIPDVDSPYSKLGHNLPVLSRGTSLVLGHRGPVHSLFACMIYAFIVNFYFPEFLFHAVIGFASHLVLDSLTGGVPFLWPLKFRIGIPLFRTMGFRELLIAFPALLIANVWAVGYYVGFDNAGKMIFDGIYGLLRQVIS